MAIWLWMFAYEPLKGYAKYMSITHSFTISMHIWSHDFISLENQNIGHTIIVKKKKHLPIFNINQAMA